MVQADWFRYCSMPDRADKITLSFDCGAKSKKQNDPSTCGIWYTVGGRYIRVGEWRERVEYPALLASAKSLIQKWKPDEVLIEDASNGQPLIADLRLLGLNTAIIPVGTKGVDKMTRFAAVTPMIETGYMVYLAEGAWNAEYVTELCTFPNAIHDDRVDETSQFLARTRGGRELATLLKDIAGDAPRETHKELYDDGGGAASVGASGDAFMGIDDMRDW